MLRALVSAALIFLGGQAVMAAQPSIDHVTPRYFDRADFQYLSEFFTGREAQRKEFIIRTDPEDRAGLYFIIDLSEEIRSLPQGAAIQVDSVDADSGELTTRQFPVESGMRPESRRIMLGFTGEDWPEPTRSLLAWRVALVSSEGAVLSEKVSFLWELPQGQ